MTTCPPASGCTTATFSGLDQSSTLIVISSGSDLYLSSQLVRPTGTGSSMTLLPMFVSKAIYGLPSLAPLGFICDSLDYSLKLQIDSKSLVGLPTSITIPSFKLVVNKTTTNGFSSYGAPYFIDPILLPSSNISDSWSISGSNGSYLIQPAKYNCEHLSTGAKYFCVDTSVSLQADSYGSVILKSPPANLTVTITTATNSIIIQNRETTNLLLIERYLKSKSLT